MCPIDVPLVSCLVSVGSELGRVQSTVILVMPFGAGTDAMTSLTARGQPTPEASCSECAPPVAPCRSPQGSGSHSAMVAVELM